MTKIPLASRVTNMTESETLKMAQKARELKENGVNVINLSLGEPDFDTPQSIKNAAKKALDDGFTKYTPVAGFADLRQAISQKFQRENNLNYPIDQIVVSNGAKQSIANVCQAMINPGDEVIIYTPYWVSYISIVELAGGTPVPIHATIDQDYLITPEQLESALTPKTKLILFSSPCNPTGSVFSSELLKSFADILNKYPNVYIISDEIYEHIVFEDHHVSFGTMPGMLDRTITVNGFSKSFAMTGWRLGYIGGPKEIVDACIKIQGQFTSGANAFAQKAGIYALNNAMSEVNTMKQEFKIRRDLILSLLKEIPGLKCNTPKGAFYVFPDISYFFGKSWQGNKIENAEDFCDFLLEEAHVATVSGAAFGADHCFRISYAASNAEIIEAISRIKSGLTKLT
jgi:aspartate aminotransferase